MYYSTQAEGLRLGQTLGTLLPKRNDRASIFAHGFATHIVPRSICERSSAFQPFKTTTLSPRHLGNRTCRTDRIAERSDRDRRAKHASSQPEEHLHSIYQGGLNKYTPPTCKYAQRPFLNAQ